MMTDVTMNQPVDTIWGLLNQQKAVRVWAMQQIESMFEIRRTLTTVSEYVEAAALLEAYVNNGINPAPAEVAEEEGE